VNKDCRYPEALDKGEGFVKEKVVLSGVGDTASRQSLACNLDMAVNPLLQVGVVSMHASLDRNHEGHGNAVSSERI
jgi:hypothetical protein